MGCSLSAIADDEDHYEYLCKKYGEKEELEYNPCLGGMQASIYGVHSKFLKDFDRGDLGNNFSVAKKKVFSKIEKDKKSREKKISAAKAKLTKKEIELLEIKV